MGAFSILNNISGIYAQNQLTQNNVNLSRTLLRLSSGKRVNSGADDAAGLQIADSLRANVSALNQAVRNANDGIGVAQIADGALQQISNILTRGVQLAEEAATGTIDSTGRASLHAEFIQIQSEIARIAEQTNFNGMQIFTAAGANGSMHVFVGDTSALSSIAVTIRTITTGTSGTELTVTNLGGLPGGPVYDLTTVNLSTAATAATALTTIKNALGNVSTMRAEIGAGMNRLQSAVAIMQSMAQNTQAAESTIRDANVAEEVANLTKYQILAQSGIAALAQANGNSQLILNLLKQ
ncbi:MAG TPA: flagellin [Acidobacteriota bacterium]|nr:flagellin [Acidobacteriota bacterium]